MVDLLCESAIPSIETALAAPAEDKEQTYRLRRLQRRSRDRSHSLSCHPMVNSDRFDDGYSPTPGRTVTALRPDERVINSASICQPRAHILNRWHVLLPHSQSIT